MGKRHNLTRVLLALSLMGVTADVAAQQTSRWTISATPETRIGDVDAADEYVFQSIAAARLLPDGRIVVADGELLEIRIYSKDGKFERLIGKRGKGPGEFSQIGGLWLTSKGQIAAWDSRNRRITVFNSRGDQESTHLVDSNPVGGNLDMYVGSYSNDDVVLAGLGFAAKSAEAVPDRVTMGRFGLNAEFRGSMGEARGIWRFNRFVIPFSPVPFTAVHADLLFVADGYEPRITVRDRRGAVARTIALTPVRTASGDLWSVLEAKLREEKDQLSLEYLKLERVPRENKFPQIAGLIIDDRGYIWVRSYDPYVDSIWLRKGSALRSGPGGEWRVVRPDGSVVATVQMPAKLRPLEIKGNRVLGVTLDEFDVEQVVVHTIQR